ncbi:MAG TPA: hypothetical protein PKA41_01895, partial [Verrucomicrobiota bacterium]|nr:hypothetical protein [Verrucomicrobiota bacterium]
DAENAERRKEILCFERITERCVFGNLYSSAFLCGLRASALIPSGFNSICSGKIALCAHWRARAVLLSFPCIGVSSAV